MTSATHPMQSQPREADGSQARALRVLFYQFFPGAGSGVGRYTHELLTTLCRRTDVSVELACAPSFHWRDRAAYRLWPGLCELSHPNRYLRKARFLYAQFASPMRLIGHARDSRPDIIHLSNINQLSYPVWSRFLGRTDAKIVATVHDVRRVKGLVSPGYDNAQLGAFYRRADALFVHGQTQRSLLIESGVEPSRITIVPHGPCNSGKPGADRLELRDRYGLPRDKQVALFFGAIRDDKNLDLFLRSLCGFQDRLHVLIVGKISPAHRMNEADYRDLIRQLELASSVTLDPRFVPEEEIPDLMTACDWVALTYGSTFTSQSGVLNVAAEYDRPVLASDIGCLGETCRNARIGILVRPDDLNDLKRGVGEMIRSIHTPGTFDLEDYRLRYSWQENANRTVEVYRRIVGRRADPRSGR